ncbi:AAA family ATPase [Embleya sp. MST-111070]|uniref:AAA family ATPase n=1 Tax=Embleya sp. MST-111070 TaxID=3398231 RepID=UPI003F7404E6
MYLSRVELVNIRGFSGARSVELDLTRTDGGHAGWTVIAGRNGSGKTTLLRAIALAISGPAVARNLVPDFTNWVSSGRPSATAKVVLSYNPDVDRFTSAGRTPTNPEFSAGLEWKTPEADSRGGQPSMTPVMEKQGGTLPSRGPWQDNPAGWFCAAYGPFRRLVGGAGEAQRLMLSPGPVARMASLFHEDASLAEGVGWLIDQHLRALENRTGAADLKAAAMAVLDDGLLPDGYRIRTVDSEGLWVEDENGGTAFPLREMSDGYRTVAALVVDLLRQIHKAYGALTVQDQGGDVVVTAPGIVIIDEVDAHLHVSWQQRIGTWLKSHFPNVQFIVTTHSPYICQAADENGLIQLPGPDQDAPPHTVSRDLYERVVFGSGDDAVLSELFGLDTPYSVRARRLRSELVALEVAVVTGHADPVQAERYRELKERLTSSPATRAHDVAVRLSGAEENDA